MPSVVIAAHNEERVITATLDALQQQQDADDLEVVVSANGCTDRTAELSRRPGVVVIDRSEPGKADALNAGDIAASRYPRIYLDADIVVPPGGLARLIARLATSPRALVVVPRRSLRTVGRPWLVRAYARVNERLPVFQRGLFGRGLIVLSEEGRARFDTFPAVIADDLFLDSLFEDPEKLVAEDVVIAVEAPFTTRDLLRRLVRVRRGNAQLRSASARGVVSVSVRPADRWAWLREVLRHDPRLLPAIGPYLALTIAAAILARRSPGSQQWGRDDSTRGRGMIGRMS